MTMSVVMPLYNGERFVGAALDSILSQDVAADEVIVVDDGSADRGPQIVGGYGARVTLISAGRNAGVQAARNAGIAASRGDWIAFCDQDDLWDRRYLAEAVALQRAAPELDYIFANFRMLRDGVPDRRTKFDQAPPGWWESAKRRVIPEGWVFDAPLAERTFDWQPVFPSGMMVARRLIDAVGGFDIAMRGLRPEDWEFTLRCLYRARAGALPAPLVTIRRHDANFSRDLVMITADEVVMLEFVRRHHAAAAPFRAIIDREIRARRIQSFDGAFAERNLPLARELLARIPPEERSAKLRVKALCLALPDRLALAVNGMLQKASSPFS